ncbi:MAG: DNA-directed RNA polymerase subunit alpha [Candidatus Doudnabacteria bacterium RIFCSPLOWO2_02_FULL_48_8]|uniref:DNA-directed RNA polymerase subunit alpha n=1 Tax=Candidatus Doudnabacteria bacterium RIFCSPHIGHO2_01_FULL_46_24 TaxID=1817825 RepID=A0A1F5NUH9_9BACT|nr:MAG: DNA-directed RNA polymerase subunit alpha [Candidatus Doudnabacteria bacterium RIFCSPHIGHO2_01_FULL_46_24]OGE93970.1 MAG: DNA-directed RNA polymerase subunit alpha [Candidatus Doudnabacteria bacterium RIFCSPHIGHO2_12_FULL_48_11]OGE94935.1 MAG: DNA-directed RNA polymerase subunit alpha [Candidatus Doudnabacteria bacterium RIFCSPLOWO2_02_FULL_48_8]
MEKIPLPNKVSFQEQGRNHYQLIMEPLYPGFGMTLGNALRRILLSSLPGAAATAVKIKGVDHEFSTIPNVKEDVIEIILNLKQLRMKVHANEPVRLELKVKGEKEVKAADFKKNSDVEIVNPELHLATLDNKLAEFEMEVIVNTGRGYVPVEQRENEKLEIGMIAVDAIYTPIRNVNFEIKHVRVGQITNYDELVMTVETDGTITGKDALDQASRVLLDHFSLLGGENLSREEEAMELELPKEEGIKTPEEDDLKSLGLSNRSFNALAKNNIVRISQLQALSHEDLINMEGLGEKSVEEIERLLAAYAGK